MKTEIKYKLTCWTCDKPYTMTDKQKETIIKKYGYEEELMHCPKCRKTLRRK